MRVLLLLLLLDVPPALALSRDAAEFLQITEVLEPVQCEKRRLRRQIALAQAESKDPQAYYRRFAELDRDPRTARLEKRLAELHPRILRSGDPEDLQAISRQQREAFYRCE